ncbi:MAG TPA: hypothetical protein VF133_18675 [Terriglobales bacterium]
MELCRQAAVERDADRLMDIVDQINRMLYEKERRLKEEHPNHSSVA